MSVSGTSSNYHFTHPYQWRGLSLYQRQELRLSLTIIRKCISNRIVSVARDRSEYRAYVLYIAPCQVKVNNKGIGCCIQEWSRWISGESEYKKNSGVLPRDLPFPPLLTLAANKVSGQNHYEEGNFFQISILPSNAFPFSLFSWPI